MRIKDAKKIQIGNMLGYVPHVAPHFTVYPGAFSGFPIIETSDDDFYRDSLPHVWQAEKDRALTWAKQYF